jgi:hypothetical protein
MSLKNIRFNIYINDSDVKITLKPNQSLNWHECHETEEGWSSTSYNWNYDGNLLYLDAIYDGRDCDGRLTQFSKNY